jgi:protease I
MARVLMVIAPERFRDEELFVTREELKRSGHVADIASTRRGRCPGSRGGTATATLTLADARAGDYDAIVFVGGGGSRVLFDEDNALRLARTASDEGRVVAAICLAPVILANAGVLRGKKATVAGTEARAIEAGGARYTGPGVTVDGHVVTANAPKASRQFGRVIGELLGRRGVFAGGVMTEKTVAEKARIKPGTTVAVLNRVPGVVESLKLPGDVTFVRPDKAQLVFLFARTRAELEARMPKAVTGLAPGAAIWIFYPKGSTSAGLDVNRDVIWALAETLGLGPLGLVSVDDTWTAFRLRRRQ